MQNKDLLGKEKFKSTLGKKKRVKQPKSKSPNSLFLNSYFISPLFLQRSKNTNAKG